MAGLINDSGYGNIIRDARKEMGDRGSKSDYVCKRATSRRLFSAPTDAVRCTLVAGKAGF